MEVEIMNRFTEIVSTQKIIDNKTKKEYRGLVEDGFIDLVNEIYEENIDKKG